MTTSFRDQAHHQMREAALAVAAEEVVARGWDSLRMRAVANRIGVSRQTLYNAFGNKHGLAKALVMRHLDGFLDGINAAVAAARVTAPAAPATESAARVTESAAPATDPGLRGRWEAVVSYSLATAAEDALLGAVLTGTSSDEFLPLLTSDGAPVIARARDSLAATMATYHPELDPDRLAAVAESVTRLTISHIVLPLQRPAQAAAHIAELATRACAETGQPNGQPGGQPYAEPALRRSRPFE